MTLQIDQAHSPIWHGGGSECARNVGLVHKGEQLSHPQVTLLEVMWAPSQGGLWIHLARELFPIWPWLLTLLFNTCLEIKVGREKMVFRVLVQRAGLCLPRSRKWVEELSGISLPQFPRTGISPGRRHRFLVWSSQCPSLSLLSIPGPHSKTFCLSQAIYFHLNPSSLTLELVIWNQFCPPPLNVWFLFFICFKLGGFIVLAVLGVWFLWDRVSLCNSDWSGPCDPLGLASESWGYRRLPLWWDHHDASSFYWNNGIFSWLSIFFCLTRMVGHSL